MRRLSSVLFFSGLLFVHSSASAQESTKEQPCNTPEARQFDFWIGEWNLTWGDEGKGTNIITSTLGGCVILENFDGTPSITLKGMSVSTFNARSGKWEQTWVDNQGGYLDFTGE